MSASARGSVIPKDSQASNFHFTNSITTCNGGMKARCLVANDITVQNLTVLNNLTVPPEDPIAPIDTTVVTQLPLTGDGSPPDPVAISSGGSTSQALSWNPSTTSWEIVRNSAATETTVGPPATDAQFNDLASALVVSRFVRVIESYTDTSAWSVTSPAIIYVDPEVTLTLGQAAGVIDITAANLLFEGAGPSSGVVKAGGGVLSQFTGIGSVILKNLTLAFDIAQSNFLVMSGPATFENVFISLSNTAGGVLTPRASFPINFQNCEFNGAGVLSVAFNNSGITADITLANCRLSGTFDPGLPAIDLNVINASVNGLSYGLAAATTAIVNLSGVVSNVGPTEGNAGMLTIILEGTKATNIEVETLTMAAAATGLAVSNVSVVGPLTVLGINQFLSNFQITGAGSDFTVSGSNNKINNGVVGSGSVVVSGDNNHMSQISVDEIVTLTGSDNVFDTFTVTNSGVAVGAFNITGGSNPTLINCNIVGSLTAGSVGAMSLGGWKILNNIISGSITTLDSPVSFSNVQVIGNTVGFSAGPPGNVLFGFASGVTWINYLISNNSIRGFVEFHGGDSASHSIGNFIISDNQIGGGLSLERHASVDRTSMRNVKIENNNIGTDGLADVTIAFTATPRLSIIELSITNNNISAGIVMTAGTFVPALFEAIFEDILIKGNTTGGGGGIFISNGSTSNASISRKWIIADNIVKPTGAPGNIAIGSPVPAGAATWTIQEINIIGNILPTGLIAIGLDAFTLNTIAHNVNISGNNVSGTAFGPPPALGISLGFLAPGSLYHIINNNVVGVIGGLDVNISACPTTGLDSVMLGNTAKNAGGFGVAYTKPALVRPPGMVTVPPFSEFNGVL